jgi:hypothetical protein
MFQVGDRVDLPAWCSSWIDAQGIVYFLFFLRGRYCLINLLDLFHNALTCSSIAFMAVSYSSTIACLAKLLCLQ